MYNKSITRSSRALIVIVIDQSGSMAGETINRGRKMSKAEMVAEVSNSLIAELIERSQRSEGIRNYFDIAIIGYSGDGVESLLPNGKTLASIKDLASTEVEVQTIECEYTGPDNVQILFTESIKSWIKPKAKGATPMYEALLLTRDIAKEWSENPANRDSFPPIIYNITDGESTDCDHEDICDIARQIKEISTNDGASLMINIHISSQCNSTPLLFPSIEELNERCDQSRCAMMLYHSASDMPEIFHPLIREAKGVNTPTLFKGVGYNSSATELITILNIGSISVKRS